MKNSSNFSSGELVRNNDVVENLPTSSNSLSRHGLPLLMGFSSRFVEGCQPPSLDENFAYFSELYGPILEEEMSNLARYTRRASTAMALGATNHGEAFWSY